MYSWSGCQFGNQSDVSINEPNEKEKKASETTDWMKYLRERHQTTVIFYFDEIIWMWRKRGKENKRKRKKSGRKEATAAAIQRNCASRSRDSSLCAEARRGGWLSKKSENVFVFCARLSKINHHWAHREIAFCAGNTKKMRCVYCPAHFLYNTFNFMTQNKKKFSTFFFFLPFFFCWRKKKSR